MSGYSKMILRFLAIWARKVRMIFTITLLATGLRLLLLRMIPYPLPVNFSLEEG
jgi:hypothetical protein